MADENLPDAPWAAPEPERRGSDLQDAPWATSAVREATNQKQAQALKDRQAIGSMEPGQYEGLKAAAWAAGDMALLHAPSFVNAYLESKKNKTTLKDELQKQNEYTEALYRQNPKEALAGDVVGLGAGMFVPLGPIAKAGQIAERVAAPLVGKAASKAVGLGTTAGGASATASYLENMDTDKAIRDAVVGFGVGTALQPVVGSIARKLTKTPNMLDEAGNLTDRARQEIRKLDPNITDADIAALSEHLAPIVQKAGGISKSTIEAARLKEFGVEPTKSMVTGVRPIEAAAPEVEQRIQAGKEALGRKADELIAAPTSPTAAAEELQKAQRERFQTGEQKFEKALPEEGEFIAGKRRVEEPLSQDEKLSKLFYMEQEYGLPNLVNESISDALKAANIPPNLSATNGFEATQGALDYLTKTLTAGNMPFGSVQSFKNIDAVRRGINRFFNGASSEDARALHAVMEGYLGGVQKAIDQKLYTGDEAALRNLKDAVGFWKQFRQDFFEPAGGGGAALREVLGKMIDPATGHVTADLSEGVAMAAQQALGRNILKPGQGLAFYERLETAIGKDNPAMDAVRASIRNEALNTNGDLTKLSRKINDLLDPKNVGLAKAIFNADRDPAGAAKKLDELRRLAKATDIINRQAISNEKKASFIWDAFKRIAPTTLAVVFGAPHGLAAQVIGSAAAEGAAAGARGVGQSRAVARELAGAPKVAPESSFERKTPYIRNVPGLYPDLDTESGGEIPPLTIRPGRATGGRIAHPESIANSLVSMADKAKKTINNNTEVLLKTPDTHVAQALEIANRQIEG
jgi:hypothetical protein